MQTSNVRSDEMYCVKVGVTLAWVLACSCLGACQTAVENVATRVWRLRVWCVCVCVLGGVKEVSKGEVRLGGRERTEEAAGGKGCKEGRRTKRAGELLMRASSRLALSPNA